MLDEENGGTSDYMCLYVFVIPSAPIFSFSLGGHRTSFNLDSFSKYDRYVENGKKRM